MKIAIIDDEDDARYLLRDALEKKYSTYIDVIVEVDSVANGIKLLNRQKIDLLFLDIQLQDGTGFDLLEQVAETPSKIVFVTAYDDFALKAFEFYAFAYLVKPFKQSRLDEVMDRILNDIEHHSDANLEMISSAYKSNHLEKIVIPELDGFQVVQTQNVLYLRSDNNYSEFYLEDGSKIISSRTLKEYEKLLEHNGFFRIHRSYLINISKVKGYTSNDGGYVKVGEAIEIPIGRRKLAQFRKIFLG